MTAHVLALVGLLLSAESVQAAAGPGQQQVANRWVAPRQRETTTAWVLPSLFGGPVAGEKVCGDVYRIVALYFERKLRAL